MQINTVLLILNAIIIIIIIFLYVKITNIVSELSAKYKDQRDLIIDNKFQNLYS
jgi:hypothetical protein